MNTLRNPAKSFSQTLAAAVAAIAFTSFSAHAAESTDGFKAGDVPLSKIQITQPRAAGNFNFNFRLGGAAGFGRSDYYFEEQKQRFEKSSTVDQAKVNPFDNGDNTSFGTTQKFEEPIFRINNSTARGSFNSLNRN